MTTRALVALGIGQCVNWGVLYYAFAILVVPLERELGMETWVVTGAFSLALLMSAALAPAVGRWCDRGRGPVVMQAGGFMAVVLLVGWLLTPGVFALYLIWGGLGLCMAAVLYEPAFVIVGRTYEDPPTRLRALALITVFGGLASTVFLPATAFLVATYEWRGAVLCLAVTLAFSTWMTRRAVFRDLIEHPLPERVASADPRATNRTSGVTFVAVAAIFTLATLASGAFTTNLIPALGERGVQPATAAILGGLMGAMQLPGRVLLLHGRLAGSPTSLLASSLLLHAVGLGAMAFAPSTLIVAIGAMVFAVGAGLTTVVRPYLIQTVFSIEQAGDLNGRVARQQQLARAAGPIVMALLATKFTYGLVLAGLALGFAMVTLAAPMVLGRTFARADEGDDMAKRESDEKTARTAAAACCDSKTLETCCGVDAKTGCCGPETAPKVCGCGASQPTASVANA
jgi:MFS family permease